MEKLTMDGTTYAVLIGINDYTDSQYLSSLKYAEKDCQDLHKVLTDSETGILLEENTTLVLGEHATTNNIREVLYKQVVKNPNSNDTVLVYFSGHGFILESKPQRAYLGTYDVNILTLLTENIRLGLRMDELYQDIFSASEAKYVLFILDCCHSGAFAPSVTKGSIPSVDKTSTTAKLVEQGFFLRDMGRIAIVSCPPDMSCYETNEFQNGVFTHYLLQGLRGEAIEQDTGEVTLDSLLTYIRNNAPSNQIPGRYGQDYGRIVLAKSSSNKKNQTTKDKTNFITSDRNSDSQQTLQIIPLNNPFEDYKSFIDDLISFIKNGYPLSSAGNKILEAVRITTSAVFVADLRQDRNKWIIRGQSNLEETQGNQGTYVENVISRNLPNIPYENVIFSRDYHGSYICYEETKVLMFIPLPSSLTKDLMVVCGLPVNSPFLGEVYGRILSSLYFGSHELVVPDPYLIEATILDDLKQMYGFISLAMYYRRFQLFRERLEKMVIYFQPILYLNPKNPYIYSWEALARNPDDSSTPIDLFKCAELWGDKFMIELDIYFLQQALATYKTACFRTPGKRRSEEIQELCVNVYPQSLVHEVYFRAVKQTLSEDEFLQPEKLILEISEKSPLPDYQTVFGESALKVFKKRVLGKYVRELNIGFAIDDFGVGHASVTRLTELNPAHVKIDRDILHQSSLDQGAVDITCRFVLDIVSEKKSHAPKVVIEGFDDTTLGTLRQLYQAGIRYVQGYIVGMSGTEIYRLDQKQSDYLKHLINNV